MRRWMLLIAVVALAGCMPDLAGLENASSYLDDVLRHTEVVAAECAPAAPVVGETGMCEARGDSGQVLMVDGQTVVMWTVAPDSVMRIALDGSFIADATGTATVTAQGPNGSEATTTVTVSP